MQKYLCAGTKRGYALKRLGVTSRVAAIHRKVRMSERAQAHVDKEILRANGNLVKELESQTKGEKKVKAAKLTLKRKVRWTKSVTRFPEALLQDFLKEVPKPEAEEEEVRGGAAKEKEPKRKSLARVAALVHDFVPPPVAKGNKRKASTSAPPKEEFVLRASMLSTRLRERFGYLCTETG